MEAILQFFSENFGGFAWLAVLFVAMLPIAEAKVAIPFALSQEVWGASTLSPFAAGLLGFIGSMLPAFFIIPFLKPVFNFLKKSKFFKGIVTFFEDKFKKQAEKQALKQNQHRTLVYSSEENVQLNAQTAQKINNNTEKINILNHSFKGAKLWQLLTLLFFVAIPLPLAGVWTSSAIAAFGDMKYWPSILAIAVGNLLEVIFVTVLCILLVDSIFVVLLATLILVLVYVVFMVVFAKVKNKKNKVA